MSVQTSLNFRANATKAIADTALRAAMRNAADTFGTRRLNAISTLSDFDALREKASAIRMEVLDNIKTYMEQFSNSAKSVGSTVHVAEDAAAARAIIAGILKNRNAKTITKSKSMMTEEIHLNGYLMNEGFDVIETDLGEYIIQLDSETPSHIIVPAIHKNRQQIARLFADKLGVAYSEDPQILTKIARNILREKFLQADAGLTGANFAIAKSGSLVIVTNEGNGRMVTTIPPLHIAVLSIDKILPSFNELSTFLRILTRSATGQTISTYISIITGIRKYGDRTGAKELHIVLVDNGRSRIIASDCKEMLKCIKCGACMNVCPVYRTIGGHAYGAVYPGPMGIILTTLLLGMKNSHPLIDASTLCGACNEVCPVKIPLMELIIKQRTRRVSEGYSPLPLSVGMRFFKIASRMPSLFSLGERLASIFWPVIKIVGGEKILGRIPRPSRIPFRRRTT